MACQPKDLTLIRLRFEIGAHFPGTAAQALVAEIAGGLRLFA